MLVYTAWLYPGAALDYDWNNSVLSFLSERNLFSIIASFIGQNFILSFCLYLYVMSGIIRKFAHTRHYRKCSGVSTVVYMIMFLISGIFHVRFIWPEVNHFEVSCWLWCSLIPFRSFITNKRLCSLVVSQPGPPPLAGWQFQLRWPLYTPVENTSHCNVTIAYEQSLLLKQNIVQPYLTQLFECKSE